jgi:sugar phosphate isomerase/epimerase
MTLSEFQLSAFGDEISNDLDEQLDTLVNLKIFGLDLRGAWGKSIVHLDNDDIARVKKTCARWGVHIACLGSPVGKSPLAEPIQFEQQQLERLMAIGAALGVHQIRIFSFYPPDTSTNLHYDRHVPESAERLGILARQAQQEGFTLLLENEKGIVTDTPERCLAVLQAVDSPALRFTWDPANFVQVGVAMPVERGWAGLKPYVRYVHIKDALLENGKVTPAGEGDGQLVELLNELQQMGYRGTLSLEPHLQIAGHSGGFSGPDGMRLAARALRKLMAETGCQEV